MRYTDVAQRAAAIERQRVQRSMATSASEQLTESVDKAASASPVSLDSDSFSGRVRAYLHDTDAALRSRPLRLLGLDKHGGACSKPPWSKLHVGAGGQGRGPCQSVPKHSAGADGMQQIGAGDAHELQGQEICEGGMPLPHVQKASVE